MKYIDLHCDALSNRAPCVHFKSLEEGECLMQVFAAFTAGENLRQKAEAQINKFDEMIKGGSFCPVRSFEDISKGRVCALLSLENGGMIQTLEDLKYFFSRGVRLVTLTWNEENVLGAPNFKGDSGREGERGLTPFGKEVVEKMIDLGMIIDVSHGSDKLLLDVADICRARRVPFVASHSGADTIFPHPRNLRGEQIRMIADSGGVVGIDFCMDFLSNDKSASGQREAILRHAAHIIKVGGEETLALGSDFDGIKENSYLHGPKDIQKLLKDFSAVFGERIVEKIASKNALRVLKAVLPSSYGSP